ncbi:MAG: hypothetical protein HYR85_18775 [Planctomycetes bacterium]|nr:hypothetical protein [Planctomycetota bacterium]
MRDDAGARLHRRLFELARETQHWVANLGDYLAFRRARLATVIRFTRAPDGRVVALDVDVPDGVPPMALRVPKRAPLTLLAGPHHVTLED